jgi:flagellar motor switch protein FliG
MSLVPVPSNAQPPQPPPSPPKPPPPTGREKSAILLANLGSELSAEVLKQLPAPLVEKVIIEMLNLRQFDQFTIMDVIEEGIQRTGAASFGSVGGIDVARDMLSRVLGSSAADDVIRRLSVQGANIPFQFLREIDRNQLSDFLAEEHPQTIAMILSRTPPDLAANIFQRLDPSLRADVAQRIATLEPTPPEMVKDVEEMLRARLSGSVNRSVITVGGIDFLVQVIMRTDRQTERTLLEQLDAAVPEIAEQVRAKMFVFEDIAKLDDRTIQRIIREVDLKELSRALKGAKDEMRVCIYRNMSTRAAEMLQDELDAMGPVRADHVSRAQRNIVNIVRRLEEQEEIIINRGNNENLEIQ